MIMHFCSQKQNSETTDLRITKLRKAKITCIDEALSQYAVLFIQQNNQEIRTTTYTYVLS